MNTMSELVALCEALGIKTVPVALLADLQGTDWMTVLARRGPPVGVRPLCTRAGAGRAGVRRIDFGGFHRCVAWKATAM